MKGSDLMTSKNTVGYKTLPITVVYAMILPNTCFDFSHFRITKNIFACSIAIMISSLSMQIGLFNIHENNKTKTRN